MPIFLRSRRVDNRPLIPAGAVPVDLCYFNLLRLAEGEQIRIHEPGFETVFVVLSGRADIAVGGQRFADVGRRQDIWSGPADSVYAGTGAEVVVTARGGVAEVAVAGGRTAGSFAPFRIEPEAIEMVEVGSAETHSRRRIFHILGQNAAGRAGNLLVSELRADAGCWSGYPPHKHDQENPPAETEFQEIYHYRYRPETGFGAQLWYPSPDRDPQGQPMAHVTRNGDTFAFESGYHPTVTSPGHEAWVFTIIVGRHQRSLLQRFDPAYDYLLKVIPGLTAMQDKFR
jgi:5-deoxy-glucuronate isomerase